MNKKEIMVWAYIICALVVAAFLNVEATLFLIAAFVGLIGVVNSGYFEEEAYEQN